MLNIILQSMMCWVEVSLGAVTLNIMWGLKFGALFLAMPVLALIVLLDVVQLWKVYTRAYFITGYDG